MAQLQDIKQLDKANVRLSKQMYQSKLLEMDKQLASSIQTQVVETSRALELLKLSYDDIIAIDANFKQIDDKCLRCKTYLSQFDQIKKLSLARNNLNITTKIGKLFDSVPNKAKTLLKLLNDNPDKYLFYVYKNLRKLVRLRDETLNKGLKYMNDGRDDVDDSHKEEEMKQHFKLIDAVILNLEKQVRMNICDALYLAVKQPETLVETLKICESEDRSNKKKNKILCYSINDWNKWREQELKEEESDDFNDDYPLPNGTAMDSMCDKVKSEILSSIVSLTEHLQMEKEKGIKDFLNAIDENMKDLDYVNENMRRTFPPHYSIVKYYVQTYYKFLQPLILAQLDTASVPTQERLFVVSWIAKFKQKINSLESDMAKYGDKSSKYNDMIDNLRYVILHKHTQNMKKKMILLSDQEERLLASYIDTCREKLRSWISNIVENESKKQEFFMVDNVPRTHCPQDLFTALNHQFTIATQQLRDKPFVNVILMILESMDLFKKLLKAHIDSHWGTFEEEYFCAMLNSCYDVSQKLKEKSDAILDQPDIYNINDAQITKLDDSFDERICLFTNMGKECAVLLSRKVFDDTLKENIFNVLFTEEYFEKKAGENKFMPSLIETLKEYAEDFKEWIEEPYFYWELVKGLLVIITNGYIEALLVHKPNHLDAEQLADYIRKDVKILDEYFGDNEIFSDVEKIWNEKFRILNAIHGTLDCEMGFFDGFKKPIQDNQKYGKDLLHYIQKLRKKKHRGDNHNYDDDDDGGKTGKKVKRKLLNSTAANWLNSKIGQ